MEMVAQTGKIVGTNTLNLWWGQTDMDAQTKQKIRTNTLNLLWGQTDMGAQTGKKWTDIRTNTLNYFGYLHKIWRAPYSHTIQALGPFSHTIQPLGGKGV